MLHGVSRLSLAASFAAMLHACGSQPASPSRRSPNPPGSPAVEAPPPQVAPPEVSAPPVAVLAELQGDLDGDGVSETITIDAAGNLRAGAWSTEVTIHRPPRTEAEATPEDGVRAFRLIDLDHDDAAREILLVQFAPDSEDPPPESRVFGVVGGALREVWLGLGETARDQIRFPGDGTILREENPWDACVADRSRRELVVFAMDAATGQYVERERRPLTDARGRPRPDARVRCDELAACPFVYRLEGDRALRMGEILRDLRGADAYARQTLALGGVDASRVLRVRVSEEKPETTFLDSISLEVEGEEILPVACASVAPRPAYCEADHVMHVLEVGQALDLTFEIPRVSGRARANLVASGYYVPNGSAWRLGRPASLDPQGPSAVPSPR